MEREEENEREGETRAAAAAAATTREEGEKREGGCSRCRSRSPRRRRRGRKREGGPQPMPQPQPLPQQGRCRSRSRAAAAAREEEEEEEGKGKKKDSDSGSSGSEFDGAKVTSPAKPVKEIEGSGATLDQEKSDILDPYDGSASGSDQVEQNPQPKPVSAGVDCHQEGENAPSGRRVSPEKLYRAAVLRNRFADTILKAREKTLGQGEKGDPEKVRREREELEKQRREEKARLQAEAKAAEDARRRANAEAAAEAKRKRELEREAARQALQKMEKTVEIDESCQFLKDLEMLGSAPIELPPSFADEMSPDRSLDVMGSFKLSGSNPLEQLGLFMKVDDEEEEGDPVDVPLHDVEEGEI